VAPGFAATLAVFRQLPAAKPVFGRCYPRTCSADSTPVTARVNVSDTIARPRRQGRSFVKIERAEKRFSVLENPGFPAVRSFRKAGVQLRCEMAMPGHEEIRRACLLEAGVVTFRITRYSGEMPRPRPRGRILVMNREKFLFCRF